METGQPRVERFIELVQTEYREMPGLLLTKPQMRRFLGLDVAMCDIVLERLVHDRFLRRTPKDAYVIES